MTRWLALLLLSSACGCSTIEAEGERVDELVTQLRGDELRARSTATQDLLSSSLPVMRHLVVPRLALESARTPIQISTKAGSILRGRVCGGDESKLLLELESGPAPGAILEVQDSSILAMRLLGPS